MHSQSALTEHVSLNLARFFFARPCIYTLQLITLLAGKKDFLLGIMAKAIPNSARMVAEEGRSCQGHSTCEEGDSERTSSNSATGERAWTVMCCSGKAVSFGPIPHDILKSGGRAYTLAKFATHLLVK